VKNKKLILCLIIAYDMVFGITKKLRRQNCFFTHKYSTLLHSQRIKRQKESMSILNLSHLSFSNIPSYFEVYSFQQKKINTEVFSLTVELIPEIQLMI